MANENDSRIVELLLKVPKEKQLEYFWEYNNAILDDSTYWQVLAGIWINTDICTPNLDKWITLFSSTRRNRHKLMKKHDRQVWHSLPQNITVYRAIIVGAGDCLL